MRCGFIQKIVLAFLAMQLQVSSIAQEKWINIAASDEQDWEVQPNSGEPSSTKGGDPIFLVVGRIVNKKSKRIDLYKWYVSNGDCDRKLGKLVTLGIDGRFLFENDFVFGGGSIASTMAKTICGVYEYGKKSLEDKGV